MRLNDRTNQAFRRFRMVLFVLFMLAAAGVLSIGLLRQGNIYNPFVGRASTSTSNDPFISYATGGTGTTRSEPLIFMAGIYHIDWNASDPGSTVAGCLYEAALRSANGAVLVQTIASGLVKGHHSGSIDFKNSQQDRFYLDIKTACEWRVEISLQQATATAIP